MRNKIMRKKLFFLALRNLLAGPTNNLLIIIIYIHKYKKKKYLPPHTHRTHFIMKPTIDEPPSAPPSSSSCSSSSSSSILTCEELLFDGRSKSDWLGWKTLHDNVMGGVSKGSLSLDDAGQCPVFSGCISDLNNGGFASLRKEVRIAVEGYTGIY